MTNTVLLLGGTGKTGRRVAERLTRRGVPIRIGSRTASPPFEWNEPATWPGVLGEVSAVYIAYYPDLAIAGAADHLRAFADVAVAHGVRRIVLLSGRGEHQVLASEAAIQRPGVETTILRAAFMCQNFSEGMLVEGVLAGDVAFPADSVREPFIDADDIADVAVAALTGNDHVGAIYDLTGPRLLTFAEATATLAMALGRPIAYTPVTFEDYARALEPYLPPAQLEFFIALFRHVLDGHNAQVSSDVQRVLGRPARDFAEYARDAAVALRA